MSDSAWVATPAIAIPARTVTPRHSALVRVTHWITTLCFLALLVTGVEIVISHPRFYWGEVGNVNTPTLFKFPIPASRATVPTGYGLLYVISSLFSGHLRKDLLPGGADLSWRAWSREIADHLRFKRPSEEEAWSYNLLQRVTYLFVIFVLFPLVIWTGLAMSPAVASAFPTVVTAFGGQQSARTIHFFVSVFLFLFLLAHIVMICLAGFWSRMRAMITGRVAIEKERA